MSLYREYGLRTRDRYQSYWTTHRERSQKRRLAIWGGVCLLCAVLLTICMIYPLLQGLFGRP